MNHLLTKIQADWCEVLIFCYKQQPLVLFASTGSTLKDVCYRTVTHGFFDQLILFIIFVNTGCLCLTWYGQTFEVPEWVSLCFNIIYTFEFAIKYVAFGNKYFSDGWNNFDFVIVTSAWLGLIAEGLGITTGAIFTIMRSFRISRIFKIIRKFKSLRVLFQTFITALPQLSNIVGLLFLFLFLYSVCGVALFAGTKQ